MAQLATSSRPFFTLYDPYHALYKQPGILCQICQSWMELGNQKARGWGEREGDRRKKTGTVATRQGIVTMSDSTACLSRTLLMMGLSGELSQIIFFSLSLYSLFLQSFYVFLIHTRSTSTAVRTQPDPPCSVTRRCKFPGSNCRCPPGRAQST